MTNLSEARQTAFICGPYASPDLRTKLQHIQTAQEAAQLLWTKGICVICPHLNTRLFDLQIPVAEKVYLDFYLNLLTQPFITLLVTTPGYEFSAGSQAELALAYDLGLPVFHFNNKTFKLLPSKADQAHNQIHQMLLT